MFQSSGGLRTLSNHAEVQKLSNRSFVNRNSNHISVDRGHMGMPLMHQALRHVIPRGCHGTAAIGRVFCWDNVFLLESAKNMGKQSAKVAYIHLKHV